MRQLYVLSDEKNLHDNSFRKQGLITIMLELNCSVVESVLHYT